MQCSGRAASGGRQTRLQTHPIHPSQPQTLSSVAASTRSLIITGLSRVSLGDPPASKLLYTPVELDSTRGYVVLAHAEIEAFCETIALDRAQKAKQVFDSRGIAGPTLRRMVAYYVAKNGKSWRDVVNPSTAVVDSAFQFCREANRSNTAAEAERAAQRAAAGAEVGRAVEASVRPSASLRRDDECRLLTCQSAGKFLPVALAADRLDYDILKNPPVRRGVQGSEGGLRAVVH